MNPNFEELENIEETGETQETGELTFAEIYQSILEKGTFSIEVPTEYSAAARLGVKNCKAYYNKKSRQAGIPTDESVLKISESDLSDGFVRITWTMKNRGTVPTRKPSIEILEDE